MKYYRFSYALEGGVMGSSGVQTIRDPGVGLFSEFEDEIRQRHGGHPRHVILGWNEIPQEVYEELKNHFWQLTNNE